MIPVFQSDDAKIGNCLQAAIASVLDLPLEAVPHFADKKGKDNYQWFQDLVKWAKRRHLGVMKVIPEAMPFISSAWGVGVGTTKRGVGDDTHAVIAKIITRRNTVTVEYIHDPVKSKAFLDEVEFILLFVPGAF